MKKTRYIGFSLILFLCTLPAVAEVQTDISLQLPAIYGFQEIGGDGEGAGEMLDYRFIVPELRTQYYFGGETFKIGPGIRAFTLILETMIYPIVSMESQFNKFVFNFHVGGGSFLFFGLFNTIAHRAIFMPEVSAAYRFTDTFSLGTGMFFITDQSKELDINGFGYIGTVFARFTF